MKKCPHCKEEIQDKAIKCKHCGSKIKSGIGCGGFLVGIFLIFLLATIAVPNFLKGREEGKSTKGTSHQQTTQKTSFSKNDEAIVNKFIRKGFIMKIDVSANEVWVDEYTWKPMPVTGKEDFIHLMSDYFKAKRGYERVTVYGGHSDRKLARKGIMGGIKFY